jgi:ribonuclease HI
MSDARKRYYAVIRGRKTGIFTSWFGAGGAQEQVKGFPCAVYRGFASRQEAEDYFSQGAAERSIVARQPAKESLSKPAPPVKGRYVSIYTDGGCINNPGPGGYGAIVIVGSSRVELTGGYRFTTNNRMELTACIVALRTLKERSRAVLTTDSQYVVNGIQKGWAQRWRSRNWMRDKVHKAENSDLWSDLLDVLEMHEVTFQWIRGHSGHPENERCDELARTSALLPDLPPDTGYELSRQELKRSRLFP